MSKRFKVLFLPNVRQTEKIKSFKAGESPDPLRNFKIFQELGLEISGGGDLNKFPINPLARHGTFYAGFDPLRACDVLLNHRDVDVVVSVFESNAFFIVLLRRLLRFSPKVILWEVSATGWRIRDRVVQFVGGEADAIFVLTRHQENLARVRFGVSARIHRVGFAIDEFFFAPSRPMTDRLLHVLSVGDDVGRDYETLIQSCQIAEIPLYLRSSYQPKGIRHGDGAAKINKIGRVSYVELRDLYDLAALVVVPLFVTDHPSGITAVFEGMAMGCAVIATDTPTTREFIIHGKTGWLVKPQDPEAMAEAIRYLSSDMELRKQLGAAAQRKINEEYSTSSYAEGFASALHTVAASTKDRYA